MSSVRSAAVAALRLGVVLATVAAFTACTKAKPNGSTRFNETYGIFSTRPQTATETVLLMKLPGAPLLAQLKDGKVDADAAKALAADQDALIAKMAAISPDIRVLYRYRLVINGVAVVTPIDKIEKLRALANVVYVETSASFTRPVLKSDDQDPPKAPGNLKEHNSVKFIGASDAHERGIRGQGMRIGIIDTGIDYTHAMFGGPGNKETYEAIDPMKETPLFPSLKVVGGIDLVGTEYDSDSANYANRTPKPDVNPLDEAGHGSHVAGTVAGHGDGDNTYDGVAPDASLYAIKVFGKEGSTGDAVIIAGFEYAADPNGDLDLSDKLDVVNLSLGSSDGMPHILFAQATQNLSRAGTMVVASAGNSGDSEYIVGAPSVAEDALSVAASVDDMDQNWKFRAVRFTTPSEPSILVEAVEGTVGKPIEDAGDVHGPLVFIGRADSELSDEVKAQLQGKIALIDRGAVTFAVKVERAFKAGAIGVVVANNQPGAPLAMGGDGSFDVPAIMVTKDFGDKLKSEMAKGEVSIAFKTDERFEKPELIDTIADFSSKGPRSLDALIKPEIAAPGSQVVSAAMGKGNLGVQFSGTSMAAPHMTGVIALLKQTHPTLTSLELKSLVMGTAKTMVTPDKKVYPVSRQGAGRVQVLRALDSTLLSSPTALSLGEVSVEKQKVLAKSLKLHNVGTVARTLTVTLDADSGLSLAGGPSSVTLAPDETKTLALEFLVDTAKLADSSTELDGLVKLSEGEHEVLRVPVLAIATKVSQVKLSSLVIHSTSASDSAGATADLSVKNQGSNAGDVYPFNLIAHDARKVDPHADPNMDHSCDLQEAGYRVVQKEGETVLQIAVKLYEPLTTWDTCQPIALIDADGDGVADQELAGILQESLKGLSGHTFASVLLDAAKARDLRKQFELDTVAKKPDLAENYTSAILALSDFAALDHSTVSVIEAPVANLKLSNAGTLSVRIVTSSSELSTIEPDDALGNGRGRWVKLSTRENGAGFTDLPEKITVAPGQTASVKLTKGLGSEKLLLLYPSNRPALDGVSLDQQSEVAKPTYSTGLVGSNP